MGSLQGGTPVNIIRLGYRDEVAEIHAVASSQLAELSRKPLVRSTNAIGAVFSDGAIVAEADGDRVLYETAFHYLEENRPSGCTVHFANARGKGTVQEIVGPLRKLGVPAAAVVDMDILADKGEWTALLRAAQCPDGQKSAWQLHREAIVKAFHNAGKSPKEDGLHGLQGGDRESAETLIAQVKQYGIFIVPGGQVESWLPSIGMNKKKDARVTKILRTLDEQGEPSEDELDDDVWGFIGDMIAWIRDTHRRGVKPSE
jgi:hypothetical protein